MTGDVGSTVGPTDNVTGGYVPLRRYVRGALELRRELGHRWTKTEIKKYRWYQRWFLRIFTPSILSSLERPYSLALPLGEREQREFPELATDEERSRPEYAFVAAEYWLEALAASCCERFALNPQSIRGLEQVHALAEKERARNQSLSFRRLMGAVVVGVAAFATIIPKDAFEAAGLSHLDYGRLTLGIAELVILGALVVAWPFLPFLPKNRKAGGEDRAFEVVGAVITLCDIRCARLGPAPE